MAKCVPAVSKPPGFTTFVPWFVRSFVGLAALLVSQPSVFIKGAFCPSILQLSQMSCLPFLEAAGIHLCLCHMANSFLHHSHTQSGSHIEWPKNEIPRAILTQSNLQFETGIPHFVEKLPAVCLLVSLAFLHASKASLPDEGLRISTSA